MSADPQGHPAIPGPRALTLAITGRCNLRCRHCLVEAGPAGTAHVGAERCRALIQELAALGGEELWLTGGEPLLHPQWAELLAFCWPQRFRTVGLQTNGALLGEEAVATLRALEQPGLAIQVSLDGASAWAHDRVRGAGSFARTRDGLLRLARAGLAGRTTIAFTEMRHNMGELPRLLELVEELGLRGLESATLLRQGRAGDVAGEAAAIEPPEPGQLGQLLFRYHRDRAFRERYEAMGRIAAIEWWKGRGQRGGSCCRLGEHPYLSAGGVLYPCALYQAGEVAVPGAHARSLAGSLGLAASPWARARSLGRHRAALLPGCRGCPGERHCGGGCMGRAQAARGDPLAAEDRCELRRAAYAWSEDDLLDGAPSRGQPLSTPPPGGEPC